MQFALCQFSEGIVRTIRNNGAVWSSARALKCSLKWGNERNPYRVLQVSRETAPSPVLESLHNVRNVSRIAGRTSSFLKFFSRTGEGEEGGDDVKSAWPSDTLGDTRVTMAGTMGCQPARGS